MNNYLDKAIDVLGSQAALARALNVAPSYVHKMAKTGHVPVEQFRKIEIATAGQVTAEDLRPDIFAPVNHGEHDTQLDIAS